MTDEFNPQPQDMSEQQLEYSPERRAAIDKHIALTDVDVQGEIVTCSSCSLRFTRDMDVRCWNPSCPMDLYVEE